MQNLNEAKNSNKQNSENTKVLIISDAIRLLCQTRTTDVVDVVYVNIVT